MNKAVGAAVIVCALVIAGRADAADLSVAPLYRAPPPALAYNWSGFYLGVNGGYGWGRSKWDTTDSLNTSGGLVGGTAGFNWQAGKGVFGIEGDLDWSGLKGSTTSTLCPLGCTTENSWLSTVRGRVGYSFDTFMPYVTGGLAIGDIKASTPGFAGVSTTNTGWTIGGGLEFSLPGNWTAKAEYLHVDLGSVNCGTNCGPTTSNNVSSRSDIVRAGVNYRFGWGK